MLDKIAVATLKFSTLVFIFVDYLFLLNRLRTSYENIEQQRERRINYYKEQNDKTHKPVNFEVGSEVKVYWSVPKQGFTKRLLPIWQGPYRT
ncbi:hypothetical protein BpHYR1_040722 [Brachionus plicatilis]|uniref:Retrovirus-related Pol poly from transposon n=1 Tax=Brachionus plicatilis TaxID=10195 RepID=A0A3M7P3W3_BRAPC|nr:hypothetical protein BpHYR1_040722 [Brachionus plicatilis]